ncbi:MAG: T9SS type A sorting domain-containing protein [Bacteroidota bacterium]
MKIYFPLLCFLLLFFDASHAQEFLTTFCVEDASGKIDSVQVGYDIDATEFIDAQFGEQDLIALPFDNNFEVRLAQINIDDYDQTYHQLSTTPSLVNYTSKIDILSRDCEEWNFTNVNNGLKPITALLIRNSDLPVTIKWDSAIFEADCQSQSLLTDWHPGGWFDVGAPVTIPPVTLREEAAVEVTTPTWLQLVDHFNDTLSMVFIRIDSDLTSSIATTPLQEVRVYPNPVRDQLMIRGLENEPFTVQVFNRFGQYIAHENRNTVDTRHWKEGLYILRIEAEGHSLIRKIVK